ncbi:hypothetical protein [Humisphaera borealis]|uniref:Uncharacterized protein n=1 Tax=Humisphaera borealis TaxID=2807512 RepID=A0A7M2WTU9_9BACT|nr:hypothetical protein [Humisphaera borealis]QOV88938.1 hypothetical protein IPV69_22350 [Humisphaera borealis]
MANRPDKVPSGKASTKAAGNKKEKVTTNGPLSGRFSRNEGTARSVAAKGK